MFDGDYTVFADGNIHTAIIDVVGGRECGAAMDVTMDNIAAVESTRNARFFALINSPPKNYTVSIYDRKCHKKNRSLNIVRGGGQEKNCDFVQNDEQFC